MMLWQLICWYLTLLFLGWVTFPLTFRLLTKLSDRGYALSRALGLLLWGFAFWLLSSLGVLQNHPGGILLVLFILVFGSCWVGWSSRHELWEWVSGHWRLIVMTEIVFMFSFIFLVLVRASDPDATGTEKPMELAFINAIIKSETFPPNDPWLSGYAISYYHFGYIMAAMLAKITATRGAIAFNLMLASVFAMGAAGAFGILYDLLASFEQKTRQSIQNLFWALLGPVFLLFISNLEAVLEVLHQAGVGWNMAAGESRFWAWINIESLRTPPSEPLGLIPQRFWWWWQASRVIQDIDLLGKISGLSPIDEFPAFSFVLGDLHPHVLVIPFVMLVIGLALEIFSGGMEKETRFLSRVIPYRAELFLFSAVLLGGIAFLNTWDLPVYFTLLVGAFVFRRVGQQGWGWDRLYELLAFAVPLGILSLVLYAPFLISLQSQAGGILPNLVYPTRGVYLWIMFGKLFVPIILFFGWLHRRGHKADWNWGIAFVLFLIALLLVLALAIGLGVAQTEIGRQFIVSQGESTIGGLLASAAVHRLKYGFGLLTLGVLLVMGVSYLMGSLNQHREAVDHESPIVFVLLMIVLGGVMVLAPEFVYLRDVFGARMNTIFKFYYQAWMLWSLAAAFAAVLVLKSGHLISKIVAIVFILLGLVYPALAYPTKTNGFQPAQGFTLDASAYLANQQPQDDAAIDWLSQAPLGVVAEAVGGQYSGYARVSTLSGQPAVLGWPGHEGQWRGGYEEVGSRESDVRALYETPDWTTALAIIQRYDIRYIFVGFLETYTYGLNIGKFEQNLKTIFQQGDVKIFEVPEILLD